MDYIPIVVLMAAGVGLGTIILLMSHFLGPKAGNKAKDSPFECGVPPVGNAQHRISVRFYLVAILFLLFDVEAMFFFPFALAYKKYLTFNLFILSEMGVFVLILLVGYIYVLRKGALEWD